MPVDRAEALLRQFAAASAKQRALLVRVTSELQFAADLAELQNVKRWPKLIEQAWEALQQALSPGRIEAVEPAVRQVEDMLRPLARAAKTYTLYCAGHAHIDMNWMWSWPETVAVTNDTFETVLRLMDEFPDFCFTQSQASVYEICRRHNPDLLARIRRRVAEGRWEVAAVHWVEGDKNLASGESLARHLLYTRQFTRQHLGVSAAAATLDWEPDTFGHAATIPSIIARGGVRRYYLCRGGPEPKPPVFWWRGPGGSRVLVNREIAWYNGALGPHNVRKLVDFCRQTGLKERLCVYGVGDHGGGPTRSDLLAAADMNTWPIWPVYKLSTTGPFYDLLEANGDKWPEITGELNFEFTGCYTSQASIKRFNRYGENLCLGAEAAAALAWRTAGACADGEALRQAWINVLFGHFHDILPGSGVRATREYQSGLFQETAATTGIITTNSLRAVAGQVDTSFVGGVGGASDLAVGAGAGYQGNSGATSPATHSSQWPRAAVIVNPSAAARDEVTAVTIWDPPLEATPEELKRRGFVARTADGAVAPAQVLNAGKFWDHKFVELAVAAKAGPLGWQTVAIEEGTAQAPAAGGVSVGAGYRGGERQPDGRPTLENEFIFVAFDSLTGGISSLIDKATGRELASPADPMGVLEYIVERPRGMSAWVINDTMLRSGVQLRSLAPHRLGPLVGSIVGQGTVAESSFTIAYTLKACSRQLEIDLSITWLQRGSAELGVPSLSLKLPLALTGARATYEIPFGSLTRPQNRGEEVPALRWADVSGAGFGGAPAGLALLNDSKYGHSLHDSTLRLRLVRSSYEPDILPEIGEHSVRVALVPHGQPLAPAELMRMADAMALPLQAVSTDTHGGNLPASASALSAAPASVVVTCIKRCEHEDALIIRLLETAGAATTATLELDPAVFGRAVWVQRCDLLEQAIDAPVELADNKATLPLCPHDIATVKIGLAN